MIATLLNSPRFSSLFFQRLYMREPAFGHRPRETTPHAGPGPLPLPLPLLLGVCAAVVCEMWPAAECRPVDFVCDRRSRTRAMQSLAEMVKTELSACVGGGVPLLSPLRLPCIRVHKASWESKSRQEKRGDIVASLGLLSEDVRVARGVTPPGCVSALLLRLEHSVANYLHILTHLLEPTQGAVESPLSSCVPQSTTSLSAVLWAYSRLITSKLEWLVVTLEDTCAPAV